MDVDRELIYQIVFSVGSILLFVVGVMAISSLYGDNGQSGIGPTGGLALVAAMIAFVILMALAGAWLERQEFDS